MKRPESVNLSLQHLAEAKALGAKLARLRKARHVLQADAALRAGLSRPTAVRIEAGDPGRTLGQLARYLHAIAPGTTLKHLMLESDPSLFALRAAEDTKRVRRPSEAKLKTLDF